MLDIDKLRNSYEKSFIDLMEDYRITYTCKNGYLHYEDSFNDSFIYHPKLNSLDLCPEIWYYIDLIYNDEPIECPWTDVLNRILAKRLFKSMFGFKIDIIC